MDRLPTIAVLGGSGELGSALARRWAQAGYPVIIGSRATDRAIEAAAGIGEQVRGAENVEAAEAADIIVLAVPYPNHAHILQSVRQAASGKIVLDVVVPLVPPKVSVVQCLKGARPRSKRRRSSALTSKSFPRFTMWGPPSCTRAARSIVTFLCSRTTRLLGIWRSRWRKPLECAASTAELWRTPLLPRP
jgi:glycerol-3-phosphate dehydrogenase